MNGKHRLPQPGDELLTISGLHCRVTLVDPVAAEVRAVRLARYYGVNGVHDDPWATPIELRVPFTAVLTVTNRLV